MSSEAAAPIAAPAAAPATPPSTAAPAAPAAEAPSASEAFEKQFDLGEPASPPAGDTQVQPPAAPQSPPPANKKPGAQAAPPAKPAPAPEFEEVDGIKVPKFKSDKEFRGWGLGGYKKAKQLETDLATLQGKHSELEQRVPKTEAERQQLAAKLADVEKRHAEKELEIQYLNYEKSSDYKDKYEKPYHEAISRAHRDVSELTVTEEDRSKEADENGKYPAKERPARSSDFDEIYQLQLGAASKLAAKKFGPENVGIIMQHRAKIRELAESAVGALKHWKDTAATRTQEQETQSIQTRERVAGLWTQVNADIKTKNKDLFDERPDDKLWNEELSKGTAMADAYFSDRGKQSIEQRVVFDAHVRNRIAAFPALVSRMRKLESELAQANNDLTALRGSGPGKPEAGGPTPPVESSDGAMSEFDKRL